MDDTLGVALQKVSSTLTELGNKVASDDTSRDSILELAQIIEIMADVDILLQA